MTDLSDSNIIFNTIFIPDPSKELLKALVDDGLEVFIINGKDDFLNRLGEIDKLRPTVIPDLYFSVFGFLEYMIDKDPDPGFYYESLVYKGFPGQLWKTLNELGGWSNKEIGEFLWPLIGKYFRESGQVFCNKGSDVWNELSKLLKENKCI